jgi:hypothetical protein
MKNATYVDQSDTIRTLTEEELAVVSGGMTSQQYNTFQQRLQATAKHFAQSHNSDYISRDPRVNARTFFTLWYW